MAIRWAVELVQCLTANMRIKVNLNKKRKNGMKIKVGGTASMKLQVFQYEPVEITSTWEVEKEFENDDTAIGWASSENEKINTFLKNDLENKAKLIVKKQSDLKKKLKEMV